MINLVIIGVLFCIHVYADDIIFNTPPYNIPNASFQEQAGSVVALEKSPAQRDQGRAGHCFAFSTASAIDYFLCNKIDHFKFMNSLCTSSVPIVSSLHLVSLSDGEGKKQIVEGGYANGILLTLSARNPSLILETCASYEKYLDYLDQYSSVNQNGESLFQTAKRVYNEQLSLHYACGEEFARILSDHTSNKDISQILAFSRGQYNSFEELLYETMIPRECNGTDKMVDVYKEIDFEIRQGVQFKKNSQIDYDYFYKTVLEQISQDTPIIINYFTGKSEAEKNRVHSALITGIKKVCNQINECKTLFRIQNSYGSGWQTQHNDGWVEADPLIERSILTTPALVWPKKK